MSRILYVIYMPIAMMPQINPWDMAPGSALMNPVISGCLHFFSNMINELLEFIAKYGKGKTPFPYFCGVGYPEVIRRQ